MADKIFSVSEINKHVKSLLDKDVNLNNVQIAGEISNFKRYPSGHCYFTLKDGGAVLKCVMFKSRAVSLRFEPSDGETVIAVGRVTVYERDGVYQLYADIMIQQGVGNLMFAYEKLKQKLAVEGVFNEERKRRLPVNPAVVGIVTSPAGAAIRDIITVARRRNPGVKIILYPVKVQGREAAAEIASAVYFFNRHELADVLIVGRGGGSIEDLWPFNEETTVRAVAASSIPVISAVGHETDITLCDFAADKRAATPSQAAELAVVNSEEYTLKVKMLHKRCRDLLEQEIRNANAKVTGLCETRVLKNPESIFADKTLRCDYAWQGLAGAMKKIIQSKEQSFAVQAALLDSMSPLAVLSRGYSVTQTGDYRVINSIKDICIGEEIITTVSDGRIRSVVQETERS